MFSTLAWAWQKELPSPTHKFLLVALADMADEEHSCFPGQERIAQMIGTSVSTVRRTLKDLETWGLITRERRQRDDGYRTSDRYFLKVTETSPVNLTGNSSPVKEGTSPVKSATSNRSTVNRPESPEESSVQKNQSERATRVDDNFYVDAELREWARTDVPSVAIDFETAIFIDYWKAVPGARGRKLDWVSTWKNWMRREHKKNLERGWKPPVEYYRAGRGNSDAA